ncbi:MAG: 4Fe-4S binding protein [Methanothermobacter tenebrarum]
MRLLDKCRCCGACVNVCLYDILELEKIVIINGECKECGTCSIVCPVNAIQRGGADHKI